MQRNPSYQTRDVERALRRLGFAKRGGKGGHDLWVNSDGRKVHLVGRHRTLLRAQIMVTARQLNNLGIVKDWRDFIYQVESQ